jgi:cyclophilin family peptidyl-prolyl cis-trans isomerase
MAICGRLALLVGVASFAVGLPTQAQTLRFTTNVGSFDMVLNPGDDANLQPLVDNLVAYVGLGRYHFSAINRAADGTTPAAADDFVLQMGSFLGFPPTPELWPGYLPRIEALEPVTVDENGDGQVDFTALSNERGTVSLALSAGNPNSGTSSFFVNLGDNAFLDSQGFVPFATIRNMETIDRIMSLQQTDLSSAAGQPGNLAFSDVPLTDRERLVVITDIEVIEADADFSFVGPIATALELARRGSASASSSSTRSTAPVSAGSIPEPGTAAGVLCCLAPALLRRRWAGLPC